MEISAFAIREVEVIRRHGVACEQAVAGATLAA